MRRRANALTIALTHILMRSGCVLQHSKAVGFRMRNVKIHTLIPLPFYNRFKTVQNGSIPRNIVQLPLQF